MCIEQHTVPSGGGEIKRLFIYACDYIYTTTEAFQNIEMESEPAFSKRWK